MRHRFAAASFLAFSLVGLLAQDKAPPANDPALPDQIAKLKTMVKDRSMEQDFLAMNLVTAMTEKFTEKSPKDQKAVVTALGEVFKLGPVRPADKSQLYRTVAEALSTCGEDAAPTLRKVLELDRIDGKEFTSLRAQLVLSLGKTKDEKQADWLLETAVRSPDDEVAAAAGEALGYYDFLPLQKLREISKRLISRYGEIDMKATQPQSTDPNAPIDFGPQNAAKTLEWVAPKWNAALTKLTGQTHQKAADWQRWLNKNKDWEPPKRA
jgi:hypothetical protein